jgi:regulator of protease activity HflC (stomatin/prohibitin superfamily)
MDTPQANANREIVVRAKNGWAMLGLVFLLVLVEFIVLVGRPVEGPARALIVVAVAVAILIILPGFFSLQPNQARVLVLFGEYKGTVRSSGLHWGNPFYSNDLSLITQMAETPRKHSAKGEATAGSRGGLGRNRISLRARTLNGELLKVNDKRGNPIEIAAVVVWRVGDTAQAVFDVDNYENYVTMQSESAVRHLASGYSYDGGEEEEITLRSNVEEVSHALRAELGQRLAKAGVIVDEARLTHLAYAPEIAQAMLRRQQAEAVIAARQKIVHGAVSMVDMALKELAEKQVVQLDDERRAAMVSNLMVVLCGESEVHPIVNAGTLYT